VNTLFNIIYILENIITSNISEESLKITVKFILEEILQTDSELTEELVNNNIVTSIEGSNFAYDYAKLHKSIGLQKFLN